jgi:hypothetical protein
MRVEVIHSRDPDSSCDVSVFVDGQPVEFEEYSSDPGAGWEGMRSEWDEETETIRRTASPAVAAIVCAARDEMAANSPYIT